MIRTTLVVAILVSILAPKEVHARGDVVDRYGCPREAVQSLVLPSDRRHVPPARGGQDSRTRKNRQEGLFITSHHGSCLLIGVYKPGSMRGEMRLSRVHPVHDYRRFGSRTIAHIDIRLAEGGMKRQRRYFNGLRGLPVDWYLSGAQKPPPEEDGTRIRLIVEDVSFNYSGLAKLILRETWIGNAFRQISKHRWSVGLGALVSIAIAAAAPVFRWKSRRGAS